jgi:LemA protein
MKQFAIILGVVLVVVLGFLVIAGLGLAFSYNGMNSRSKLVDNKWAQVQNDYQRRADLIPNLVNTVSGAANFEKSTLVEITQARASVGQLKVDTKNAPATAEELAQFQRAQGQLGSALSRLLVVSERYPELKANNNFRDLQAQLEGTENRITVARKDFNDAVLDYNRKITSFPAVFYAGMFHFKEKPYFQAAAGAETVPKVQFDFNSTPAPATNKP